MLHADPLDLLFENRNKSYGAYTLRKYYPQRLMISLGITFAVVLISELAYLYFQSPPLTIREFYIPDTNIDPIYYPKEKLIIPPARPSAPKPPASFQYKTPVIVADQKVPEPMTTIAKLDANAIGLITAVGGPDNEEPKNNGISPAGTTTKNSEPPENKREILDRADIMPEFPGGVEALKRFLLKNLRMPENGLDAGTEIHVIARFIVGADGRVRDIEFTKEADAIFNKEVKRVISKMPDWKPGSQNHRNVAVYFSLPVNFVNAE